MFKKWAKKLAIIAVELFLISAAFWYLIEKRGLKPSFDVLSLNQDVTDAAQNKENQRPFPAETEPVEKKYSWQYKGVKYELDQTLYKSSYNFYISESKTYSYTGELPINWEDQYYGMFLKKIEEDKQIEKLASDIQNLGIKNKLSDDEIVELALSFVQSIPYDDAKAKEILSKAKDVNVRYPYEVLFDQLGVCSDKSILSAALLRQMGYGAALFAYESDNHMAVAVECPKELSSYGSGYCFAETTAVGNKIGIIPDFDQTSNRTVSEFATIDANESQPGNTKQLGPVMILQATHGKVYNGVAATQKQIAEIAKLKEEIRNLLNILQSLKKTVLNEEDEMNQMNDKLNKYRKEENVEKFNSLVSKYNDLLETYEKNVKKYNSSVAIYNQTIARYNLLIR